MKKCLSFILCLAFMLSCCFAVKAEEEAVHLHIVVLGSRPDDGDLVYGMLSDMAKRDINTTFEIQYLSIGDYTQRYPLMLSAAEDIDLIYTSSWCFYAQEATKGSFLEVTEEIVKTYMPLTYANQNPLSFEQAEINGKVYFVPFNKAEFIGSCNNAVLIRGDLREKYNLDPIDSIEAFAEYLECVAEGEALNGIEPYAASQNNDLLVGVTTAYNNWCVINGLSDFFVFKYDENNTIDDVVFMYETEEYRQNALLMKEWADKGFWSKNAIANATATVDSFKNGLSASYIADVNTVGNAAKAVDEEHPEWKVEMYDLNPGSIHTYGSYNGDGFAVTSFSKHPENAFMLLDLLKFDKEYYELFRYGIEGKHWIAVGDDKWEAGPDQSAYPYGTGTWGIKNSMYERTRTDAWADVAEIFASWTVVDTPWAAFIFDDSNVKSELANLNDLRIQYDYVLDLGMAADVDATLNEFIQKCKLAGLETVRDELYSQLSAFIEAQADK